MSYKANHVVMLTLLLAGALKLVGEAFFWQGGSQFVYTQDNHNSVLGTRELALDCGATASCVEIDSHDGMSCAMGSFCMNSLVGLVRGSVPSQL